MNLVPSQPLTLEPIVNSAVPQTPALSSVLPTPIDPNLVEFTSPHLWNEPTQSVINTFRLNLQQWTVSYCQTCLRVQPFSRTSQVLVECRHCKNQRDKGKVSHFGAGNDMDPGPVHPFSVVLIILDT
jgi:hypothetical protein